MGRNCKQQHVINLVFIDNEAFLVTRQSTRLTRSLISKVSVLLISRKRSKTVTSQS